MTSMGELAAGYCLFRDNIGPRLYTCWWLIVIGITVACTINLWVILNQQKPFGIIYLYKQITVYRHDDIV